MEEQHGTSTTTAVDDVGESGEYGKKHRIGPEYQAVCPTFIPLNKRKPKDSTDRSMELWSPTDKIPDNELEEFISLAKDKDSYNLEQALGMLCWHKYDKDRAFQDMANYTPIPEEEWLEEDKALFEKALKSKRKNLKEIQKTLPHKSMKEIVKYYYTRKLPQRRRRGTVGPKKGKAKKKK